MDAIEGNASPRKPERGNREQVIGERIFEVAWALKREQRRRRATCRSHRRRRGSGGRPPRFNLDADARGARIQRVSSSSLTTEAGRSTTSPAAIWLAT